MSTPLGRFKEQVSLLCQLVATLKDDPSIEKTAIKINLGLRANPREIAEVFIEEVFPSAEAILEGNDKFFLERNISGTSHLDSFFNKLKKGWQEIDIEDQNRVKQHLKVVLILGCLVTRHVELLSIINRYRDIDNYISFVDN